LQKQKNGNGQNVGRGPGSAADKLASAEGLTSGEAQRRQAQYGKNEWTAQKKEGFFKKILEVVLEPMFLLLLVAATIYFILGEPVDGAIMLVFVCVMIGIEAVQEWKTDKTLRALKDLSAPHTKVIRDGAEKQVPSSDLVPGDLMLISEGVKIPADGIIVCANDLCIDESSLTGEAEGVWKQGGGCQAAGPPGGSDYWRRDYVYAGTLVLQGGGTVKVEKIGVETEYGKIGKSVAGAEKKRSPLQKQTGNLVKVCAGIAAVLFALVGLITYLNIPEYETGDRVVQSILAGIALAMATIPEEFPVILTVFLSMGAWRLAKKDALVRKMPVIETLGAVSVLCVDKTGTITKNQMTLVKAAVWRQGAGDEANNEKRKTNNEGQGLGDRAQDDGLRLLKIMGMACETQAYDPMEKAMLEYCEKQGVRRAELFRGELLAEYSFTNALKMMGHVWQTESETVICVKGSPESVLRLCNLSDTERAGAEKQITALSSEGLRVIAVGEAAVRPGGEIPADILDCRLRLCGFVGLYDPPRDTVRGDIAECKKAGIRVVMITGDNGVTARKIAREAGIPNCDTIVTGAELNEMTDEQLRECVKSANIFSRVLPEHKMRIVKALRENGEIVAMTGDGVNDAPALKHADIGIAMGKRGSDVSREAADMVLLDDNFSTIVTTVRDGRRIYQNIKKAVGYVFTIHIPIALAALLAPLLGIPPESLMLLPLQIMLLELIVDPTCSIVLERQPPERNLMEKKPRGKSEKLLSGKLMLKSVLQGLAIFAASFGSYYYILQSGGGADAARAMAIAVLMLANLFVVQVNCSDKDSVTATFKPLMKDKIMWAANILTFLMLAVILYTPLNVFLKLAPLSAPQFFIALGLAAASVLWYEIVKFLRRRHDGAGAIAHRDPA